jgi:hypothetical protein
LQKQKGLFLACFGSKVPTNFIYFLVIYVRQFFNKMFCQFNIILNNQASVLDIPTGYQWVYHMGKKKQQKWTMDITKYAK